MKFRWMSRQEAEYISADPIHCIFEGYIPATHVALISITDPNKEPAKIESRYWTKILRLSFYDEREGSVLLNRDNYPTFNESVAKQVLQFVESLETEVSEIWIHCEHGRSRSAAIAAFLALIYNAKLEKPCIGYNDHVFNTLMKQFYNSVKSE